MKKSKKSTKRRIASIQARGPEQAKAPTPVDVAETYEHDFDEDNAIPFVPVEINSSDNRRKEVQDAACRQGWETADPAYQIFPQFADTMIAVIAKDGRRWVAINDICEDIGAIVSSQRSRLCADTRFHWKEFLGVGSRGQECTLLCVAAEQFNAWLSGIDLCCLEPGVVHRFLSYQLAAINEFSDLHQFRKLPSQPVSLHSRLQRLEEISTKTLESVSIVNRFFLQFAEYELMIQQSQDGKAIATPQVVGGKTTATPTENK